MPSVLRVMHLNNYICYFYEKIVSRLRAVKFILEYPMKHIKDIITYIHGILDAIYSIILLICLRPFKTRDLLKVWYQNLEPERQSTDLQGRRVRCMPKHFNCKCHLAFHVLYLKCKCSCSTSIISHNPRGQDWLWTLFPILMII